MERAADILDAFFRRHNIAGGETYTGFYRSWEKIVGQDLASHTNLTEIRNSALCVEVDHPAWMQLVQIRQGHILKAVQTQFPSLGIRSLQLRLVERLGFDSALRGGAKQSPEALAAGGRPSSDESPSSPAAHQPVAGPAAGESEALERIDSPALRASLERLRRAISRRPADTDGTDR